MADEIRRLSEELARDPDSLVFLPLGEALRRAGQLALALKVARRGLERHRTLADAHDLVARIHVDRDELAEAYTEWEAVLRLAPGHLAARKGMGYVLFKQGRLDEAEQHLGDAAAADAEDASIATALRMVRRLRRYANGDGAADGHAADHVHERLAEAQRRVEQEARRLFADILGDGEQTALLLDGEGLVTAGTYVTAEGRDVSQDVGAALGAVREEAERTARLLGLGAWRGLVFETDVATVGTSPAPDRSLVLVASARSVPLGLVRRVLDRCVQRAGAWLAEAS